MEIHKIGSEDWQILKRLILDSLADSPDAFPATLNGQSSCPDATWRGLANKYSSGQREVAYTLVDNQGYCGILIGSITNLGHLWVSPRIRESRYRHGTKLLDTFLEWARKRGSSNIHLFVTENTPAVNFYESMGFKSTGNREKLRTDSKKIIDKVQDIVDSF